MAMVSSNHLQQVNLPVIIDLRENEIHQAKNQPQEEEAEEIQEVEIIRMEIEEDDFIHIVSNEQAQEREQVNIENEEEEEEDYDYDDEDEDLDEDDDDIYYLNDHITQYHQDEQDVDLEQSDILQHQQQQHQLEDQQDENDSFYLANKTFYTTCHKISRQNSPSYRKRPPYTFLENWLIHSVFSKSQQILLRFPVIHPKVMMTEGDFIYTPHQQQPVEEEQQDVTNMYYYQDSNNHMQDIMEEDEEEYYNEDEDDAFIIGDEGVIVMSASAPDVSQFMALDDDEDVIESHSMIMDENMWMGHSRYNSNGLTLHVVNPDEEDSEEEEENQEQDPMYHNVSKSNNPYKSILYNQQQEQRLEIVKEEEEMEEEEEEKEDQQNSIPISISPEILNWYRTTTDNTTLTTAAQQQQQEQEEEHEECHSSTSSTYSNNNADDERIEKTHSAAASIESISSSYQSLADIIQEEGQSTSTMYGTLLATTTARSIATNQQKLTREQPNLSPLVQVSVCFVDAAWVAMDLAQRYTEESTKGGISGFITTLFRIWKVLFLGAETMLGWENHRGVKSQAIV